MASRLDQAQKEAYASAPRDIDILWALIISHPTFDDDIRVVMYDARLDLEEIPLIVASGQPTKIFKQCAFEAIRPGFGDDGPTEWTLAVDNVSGDLTPHLELTLSNNEPIEVTFLAYRSSAMNAPPGEVIEGYKLREVQLGSITARGTLFLEDIATQAFPRKTYTLEDFPSLWRR